MPVNILLTPGVQYSFDAIFSPVQNYIKWNVLFHKHVICITSALNAFSTEHGSNIKIHRDIQYYLLFLAQTYVCLAICSVVDIFIYSEKMYIEKKKGNGS